MEIKMAPEAAATARIKTMMAQSANLNTFLYEAAAAIAALPALLAVAVDAVGSPSLHKTRNTGEQSVHLFRSHSSRVLDFVDCLPFVD